MNWTEIIVTGIIFTFVFMLSCFMFFMLDKKLRLARWVNEKFSRAVIVIFITFVLYLAAMSFIRTTNISVKYYDIFEGIFLGLPCGFIFHIFNKEDRRNS